MVRNFSALAEIRKHPGVAAGVVAVLAGVGLATLLLNQRSGPTRYERIRESVNPARLWSRLRAGERLRDVRDHAEGGWDRVSGFADRVAGRDSRRRAAAYARDHAQEGAAAAAVATIAAAIGAAALKHWQDRR